VVTRNEVPGVSWGQQNGWGENIRERKKILGTLKGEAEKKETQNRGHIVFKEGKRGGVPISDERQVSKRP